MKGHLDPQIAEIWAAILIPVALATIVVALVACVWPDEVEHIIRTLRRRP